MVMRFCLWLSPLASLACHAKPQHPGDRDNRRSLPSGQSRVLIDTEPGKWLSVKSDQGDILRIVILVFYFSKTGILIFLIQILMAFIHTNKLHKLVRKAVGSSTCLRKNIKQFTEEI